MEIVCVNYSYVDVSLDVISTGSKSEVVIVVANRVLFGRLESIDRPVSPCITRYLYCWIHGDVHLVPLAAVILSRWITEVPISCCEVEDVFVYPTCPSFHS